MAGSRGFERGGRNCRTTVNASFAEPNSGKESICVANTAQERVTEPPRSKVCMLIHAKRKRKKFAHIAVSRFIQIPPRSFAAETVTMLSEQTLSVNGSNLARYAVLCLTP
jgi:hypothetical protein